VINDSEKRTGLAEQAGAWSEKILESSGLLNPCDLKPQTKDDFL